MPIDRDFRQSLITHIEGSGWSIGFPDGDRGNPLLLPISKSERSLKILLHARKLTYQARSGPDPSTHNRPAGEMHTQMIFDGNRRGAGIRNHLRFEPDTKTVLYGHYHVSDTTYIIAAYDAARHQEYAYSKSLQVKDTTIEKALRTGIAFQERKNGEIIVAFHISEIMTYFENAESFHKLTLAELQTESANLSPLAEETIRDSAHIEHLPELRSVERRIIVNEVIQHVRNANFTKGIRAIYERCAICGFQYDYVLDAAHIIPVSEGGDDTYQNGMGLCPTCHRMYDKGFILVDDMHKIHINARYAEEYDQIGRADSLEELEQRLRDKLWLPENTKHRPATENLRVMFVKRR